MYVYNTLINIFIYNIIIDKQTASIGKQLTSMDKQTASLETQTASLETQTASLETHILSTKNFALNKVLMRQILFCPMQFLPKVYYTTLSAKQDDNLIVYTVTWFMSEKSQHIRIYKYYALLGLNGTPIFFLDWSDTDLPRVRLNLNTLDSMVVAKDQETTHQSDSENEDENVWGNTAFYGSSGEVHKSDNKDENVLANTSFYGPSGKVHKSDIEDCDKTEWGLIPVYGSNCVQQSNSSCDVIVSESNNYCDTTSLNKATTNNSVLCSDFDPYHEINTEFAALTLPLSDDWIVVVPDIPCEATTITRTVFSWFFNKSKI
jgi:hypothetical protein